MSDINPAQDPNAGTAPAGADEPDKPAKSLLQRLRETGANYQQDAERGLKEFGQAAKGSIDESLNENVNEPLANAGFPKAGAAISAVGSAAADMAIPESKWDVLAAALPVGKAGKAAGLLEKEGAELAEKAFAKPAAEAAERTINYGMQPKKTITAATTGMDIPKQIMPNVTADASKMTGTVEEGIKRQRMREDLLKNGR